MTKVATILANQIIELITSGKLTSWKQGWTCNDSGYSAFNATSGRKYTGVYNAIILNVMASGRLPAFATLNHKENRLPKTGTKAVKILQPTFRKVTDKKTGEEKDQFCGCRYMNVWHYSDMTGIDTETLEAKYAVEEEIDNDFNAIGICEQVVSEMENCPEIEHGGNRAFYRPSTDSIGMPIPQQFENEQSYYHTLFHELAHSTMHVTRLDRKQSREGLETDKHEYSFEELVAELSACTLASECGILDDNQVNNSASYMKSWIKPLQNNPEWIMKASSQASRVQKYILGN